jgi:mRNA interferase MazF
VYWTRFDPVEGSEIGKTRPAVVVSVDLANRVLRTAVVVPLTGGPHPPRPNECRVPSMDTAGRPSVALAHQVRTLSAGRLLQPMATVAPDELFAIERAPRWQLGL